MEVSNYSTMVAKGYLHPSGHSSKTEGPWNLRFAAASQPEIVQEWEARSATFKPVLLALDQPNERDNFTLLYVLFLRGGTRKPPFVAGMVFHRALWHRRPSRQVDVYIKKRYGNSFPHPVPIGKYSGTCMYDPKGRFAVFTFQAVTLKKGPEPQTPKTIITPGDKGFGQSLRDAERALHRTDGVGG